MTRVSHIYNPWFPYDRNKQQQYNFLLEIHLWRWDFCDWGPASEGGIDVNNKHYGPHPTSTKSYRTDSTVHNINNGDHGLSREWEFNGISPYYLASSFTNKIANDIKPGIE